MSATAFQRHRRELAKKKAEEEKQASIDPEFEALKEKGKDIGVKNWHVMGKEKLQEAIAEKEGTGEGQQTGNESK